MRSRVSDDKAHNNIERKLSLELLPLELFYLSRNQLTKAYIIRAYFVYIRWGRNNPVYCTYAREGKPSLSL